MTNRPEIRPQPGPQERFLSSPADICLYGGAAGGGKTWALLLEPLRHIHNPGFGCVTFRRTSPQITSEGGLWAQSEKLYPLARGRPKAGARSAVRQRGPTGFAATEPRGDQTPENRQSGATWSSLEGGT